MRLALISLIATAGLASTASAQMDQMQPQTSPGQPMPMPMPAPNNPSAAPASPSDSAPPAAAAATPPAPPAPPTDPAAIALVSTLDNVCIPAVAGGDLAKLAKAAGFHSSGDNFVEKRQGYQLTILAPGSNPTQCHVDVVHPIDPEAPAKPIVVALHNWAVDGRGWSLYRNDKSVTGAQELTTRSWEHDSPPNHEALVITTYRKADGTPSQHSADTSTMIYSLTKMAG
jgi:hypothetical protein